MHSSKNRRRALALAGALVLPFAAPLAARADGDAAETGTGVARISFVQGTVSVQRGDSATPVDAAVNAPVLGADYLSTGTGARAEVQLDGRSAIRLGEDVQMRFAHLDAGGREVQLAQGTIDLRVVGAVEPRTDVDTPSVTVHPVSPGSFRITVGSDGRTFITARSGRAEVVSPQGSREVDPGSTLIARGTAANPTIETVEAIASDAFDAFNRERDVRLESALAATQPYVNPNVSGVGDLDAYGRWVQDAQYGQVWVPSNVASDWAPYRDGRWVWEDGFGWTWVGNEPWGWAPYHYGRWFHSARFGWAWFPPPVGFVEVWRPALVGFFGFGSFSGFSVGFANVGWCPLAPFEPFRPWFGRGFGNNVTIVNNITVINNGTQFGHHFRNALFGGATAISHERFLQGRFDHRFAVMPGHLRNVHVANGALPFAPTTANLRFSERTSNTAVAMHPAFQRSFAGTGNVALRTPFEQQRTAVVTRTMPRAAGGSATQRFTESGVRADRANVTTTNRTTDPWARFGTARGSSVQVIDGAGERGAVTTRERTTTTTTTTSPTATGGQMRAIKADRGDAWGRFESSSQGRPRVERANVQPATGSARTFDGETRTRTFGGETRVRVETGGEMRTRVPETVRPASAPPPAAQRTPQSGGGERTHSTGHAHSTTSSGGSRHGR